MDPSGSGVIDPLGEGADRPFLNAWIDAPGDE
jgi:hypothetical protein